jgi:hypothetical protein
VLLGTGKAASGTTVVDQFLTALPTGRRGSVYDFGFVALRHHLSRTVIAWMKVDYLDGSYQPVLANPLAGGPQPGGIGPGNDTSWQAYGGSTHATHAIASIEVFICDTGPKPLTGSVQISDVSLAVRRPRARAFDAVPTLTPGQP